MELDLRMILLLIGLGVMGLIILDGMRRKIKIQKQVKHFEETVLSAPEDAKDPELIKPDPLLEEGILSKRTFMVETPNIQQKSVKPAPKADDLIAVSLLMENGTISGRALNGAIQANQLKFGDKRLYHKHRADKIENEILFSLASLTKPGYFEPNKMATSQFKGVLFFMNASSASDPIHTFEKMLSTARMMASSFQAQLVDEKRQPLTPQKIEQIKNRIRDEAKKDFA